MYLGARPDKALYTKKSVLNFTGSQCKDAKIGEHVIPLFYSSKQPRCKILDNLETRNCRLRQATIKGVTVIQA